MQMDKLTERHEKFLQEVVGVPADDFKRMSHDELDALVDDKLMDMECDGVDDNLPDGITEDGGLAADLIDIIYGPYDSAEFDKEMQEEDADE
jgi:hypothetical protein